MKVSCDIIKDLLPLYYDGVCSEDSKELIEEHFHTCDTCKAELNEMKQALSINKKEENLREAQALQTLSKKWKKGMFKSLLEGVLITILLIVAIAILLFVFMDIRAIPKLY